MGTVSRKKSAAVLAARVAARPHLRVVSGELAHKLLWRHFMGLDREHLWRVDLDARCGLLGAELVSIGTVDSTLADPRMVFKGAIAVGAAKIILLHNHPSGDVTPSTADRGVAARLEACGLILGIDVVDQVIVFNEKHFRMGTGP